MPETPRTYTSRAGLVPAPSAAAQQLPAASPAPRTSLARTVAGFLVALPFAVALLLIVATAVGLRPFVILSDSMAPAIQRGDMVLVDPDRRDFTVGTIATYTLGATTVTHRITPYDAPDGHYVFKGDGNGGADSTPIPEDAIEGTVRFLIPQLALPVLWADQPDQYRLHLWLLGGLYLTAVAIYLRPRRTPPTEPQHPPATTGS